MHARMLSLCIVDGLLLVTGCVLDLDLVRDARPAWLAAQGLRTLLAHCRARVAALRHSAGLAAAAAFALAPPHGQAEGAIGGVRAVAH